MVKYPRSNTKRVLLNHAHVHLCLRLPLLLLLPAMMIVDCGSFISTATAFVQQSSRKPFSNERLSLLKFSTRRLPRDRKQYLRQYHRLESEEYSDEEDLDTCTAPSSMTDCPVTSGRRGFFLSTLTAATSIFVQPISPSFARGLVQFPVNDPKQLLNTYHFLRVGESLLEEEDIWSTNPLFL